MSDARTLIIVTMEASHIFQNFRQTYSPDEQHKDNIKVLRTINEENIFLIGRDQPDLTTTCVQDILSSSCNDQSETIICTHKGYINTGELSQKVIMFSHSDEIGKKLLKFAKKKISFDSIWNYLEKKSHNSSISQILHLFLPLDIDMQALEILAKKKENGEKVKEPNEYLKEMYADNINYLQKFNELQAKVKELSEIEGIDKERLEKLAGISNQKVSQFFKELDNKKNDPYKFLGHSWGIDGVKSFPNWHRALATCLRGKEVYEKVRKYLYENIGHLTTPGTPRFDIKTETWKVPVLCRTERGILIVGEFTLDREGNLINIPTKQEILKTAKI